jgi:NifU-like protein involved in Fe-S cluster formation
MLSAVDALPPLLRTHFLEPRGAAPLDGADLRGSAGNAACGDRLELGLWLADGRIARAAFQARGCSSLIAAASLACERLQGRDCHDFAGVDPQAWLSEAGGLPPRGAHAALVVRRAWQEAVRGLTDRYP